jgi:hypothetical protein
MTVSIRRFEQPDERREFLHGAFEVVSIGGITIGRASYDPGWRWSTHVGGSEGARCDVDHVGLVLSGRAAVLMNDGSYYEMSPGDIFAIAPGHDSWVVGDEPYVSLHLIGASIYAAKE